MRAIARASARFLRELLASERLDDVRDGADTIAPARDRRVLRTLLEREQLAELTHEPAPARPAAHFLTRVLARERLPDAAPPARARRPAFLTTLLRREALQGESAPPPPAKPSFLRWLLAPERLPDRDEQLQH
jgi:hypothetical protein